MNRPKLTLVQHLGPKMTNKMTEVQRRGWNKKEHEWCVVVSHSFDPPAVRRVPGCSYGHVKRPTTTTSRWLVEVLTNDSARIVPKTTMAMPETGSG